MVASATDLTEVLGGAIALRLLFDLPLRAGGVITAVVSFALLGLQTRGARPFEVAITRMRLVVLVGFGYSLVVGGVDASAAATGLVPHVEGSETVVEPEGNEMQHTKSTQRDPQTGCEGRRSPSPPTTGHRQSYSSELM